MNIEQFKSSLESFKKFQVQHAMFKYIRDELLQIVANDTDYGVVLVTGPSGVGKSTVAKATFDQYIAGLHAAGLYREDHIPAILAEVASTLKKEFDWSDFYQRLLHRSSDPFMGERLAISLQRTLFGDVHYQYSGVRSASTLRMRAEECLKHRGTKVLLLDQAQRMFVGRSDIQIEQIFETLNAFACETKTIIVLFGTYELLSVRDFSGQLARAVRILHFSRYDATNETHDTIFKKNINSLLEHLPFRLVLSDDERIELYHRSIGCFGNLKEMIERGLAEYIARIESFQAKVSENEGAHSSRPEFDFALLRECSLSSHNLFRLAEEAVEGEERFRDVPLQDVARILRTKFTMPTDAAGIKAVLETKRTASRSKLTSGQFASKVRAGKGRGIHRTRIGIPSPTRNRRA